MSDDALVERLQAHYGTVARRAARGGAVADDDCGLDTRAGGCYSPAVEACGGPVVEAAATVFGSSLTPAAHRAGRSTRSTRCGGFGGGGHERYQARRWPLGWILRTRGERNRRAVCQPGGVEPARGPLCGPGMSPQFKQAVHNAVGHCWARVRVGVFP